jgi:PAS domain S-box-containing protein
LKNKIATFLKKHSSKHLKQDILKIGLIGAAYFLAVHISFLFPDSSNILMAVWPASGIGLAALLLNPRRLWFPILLALFLTGIIANLHQDRLIINSIGFMTANVLESFTCAWLITKWCGTNISFTRLKEVVALLAAATIINAGTACVGAGFASSMHLATYWGYWRSWWISDGLGILLITPLIVSWITFRISIAGRNWGRIIEGFIFFIVWFYFIQTALDPLTAIEPYMLVALIAWVAIRFGLRLVTLALAILTVMALIHKSVIIGPGQWDGTNLAERITNVQIYIGIMSITSFFLAAAFTERKQSETALRESEASYRNQFLKNTAIMLLTDTATRAIIDVNDTALKFYGYSREQMLSMLITDINRLSASEFLHLWDIVLEKQGGLFNTQHCLANGSMRDVSVSTSLIKFKGHEVLHSIVMDITERKYQEKKILEIQNRLELATTSAQLGIWDWNIVNNILTWDDMMYKLYGITDRTANSRFALWQNSLHPEDLNAAMKATQMAISGEKKYDTEFRVRHPNGAVRYIKADGIVLLDENGKAVRMIGINRDITEQKLAEKEHAQHELQLQRAQKLESLGVLAGGIAHDFNNMLSGIFGYMDMAKENLKANKPDKCMDSIVKASSVFERAKGLTQQLLTFSRGGTPKKTTLQLKPIIEKNTRFVLSGSNILCQFDIPDSLWVCDVDENQFGQVVDNILINAMQAMPMGGTLTLSAENIVVDATGTLVDQQKGNFVCITIHDTGIGISKEKIANIFDPFYTTKQSGHGLGLATAHSIVKSHNGWIDVDSEPGKGTTFNVYFPASLQKEIIYTKTSFAKHIGNGTIVVMDDEEYIRDILSGMLSSMGYTIMLAKNCEETIALVKHMHDLKESIVAVILDLTIPGGIGGKDTLLELLKLYPDIIAIASSGYSNDPVMAMPLNYGFKASLTKPYSKNDIAEVLSKVIDTA